MNIFSQSVACLFILLRVTFYRVKVFNFDKVQFINFFLLMYGIFCVISKKSMPNPESQRFSPVISRSFTILGFRFKFMIDFELISYIYSLRYGSKFHFLHMNI